MFLFSIKFVTLTTSLDREIDSSQNSHPQGEEHGEPVDCPMSIEAHVELSWRSGCKYPTNINSGGLLSPNLLHSEAKRAQTVVQLASELGIPHLTTLIEEFLFQQLNPDDLCSLRDVPWYECPSCNKITVINSAVALFYAPSDISGIGGMQHKYIRSCPSWQNRPPRYDCAFVNTDPRLKGMCGLDVMRVLGFFFFCFSRQTLLMCNSAVV